jgi:hypothetical protein
MSPLPEEPPRIPATRPVLVWVISIFYFISAGFTILSLALIYSGLAPLRDEQRQYFQSLTAFDHTMTVLIAALNFRPPDIAGGVC